MELSPEEQHLQAIMHLGSSGAVSTASQLMLVKVKCQYSNGVTSKTLSTVTADIPFTNFLSMRRLLKCPRLEETYINKNVAPFINKASTSVMCWALRVAREKAGALFIMHPMFCYIY